MLSSETAKTVSARKRIVLLSIGGVALVVVAAVSLFNFLHWATNSDVTVLKSNNKRYTLQVAATTRSQALGLGNRTSLPKNQGMLFVFQKPAVQCFWMKDMHFPIDMVWVSSDRRVEYVESNVSPKTYPHLFCPAVQARYVIELNAGQAKQADIRTGKLLSF
jgi:uncharacterized membrane protein (UPF0127 family)